MFSAAKVDPSKWPSSSAASSSRSPSPPPSSLPSAFGSTSTSPGPPAGPTRIPPPALDRKTTKNVQLHGDLHALRCTVCAASYAFAGDWVDLYASGDCVACPACEERVGGRVARGQRALATGVLRPGIVLYDEVRPLPLTPLPPSRASSTRALTRDRSPASCLPRAQNHPSGDLIGDLQSYDLQRSPDLLLVLGTSLKVHGLKRLVKELAKAVHALPPTKARPDGGKGRVVFVNKTAPGKEWDGVFDTWVEGECDRWVDGVEREWRRVRGRDFEAQTTLAGLGKTVKGAAAGATAAKPVKGEPKQTAAAAAGPKSIKGLPKALDKPAAGPMGPPRSPVKKAQQQQPSAAASSSTPKPKAKPAPSPARSMAPSSPLPAFSSPAHAHAHVLSPAQRAVNVPAPNGRPALSPAQKAAGARSPTKKARMLSAGGISKGKARAYASDDDLSTDDNDDDDDKVLLVERGPDGSVKLSPVGRFAALPSPSTHAHASSSSSTPRRPPPPPPAFASHPTPGRSTPRAPLPPTAGGARKRAPGTPVDGRRSPFVVRPPPATAVLLADASAKRRRQRADGRAKEAARRSVLEAAGVVPRAEVIELD